MASPAVQPNSRVGASASGKHPLLEELQRREEAREHLIPFCQYVWPGFKPRLHRQLIAGALEMVERGEISRLMVFTPPQIGKLVADDTPVWTPDGWRKHGLLQEGDYVYHPSGKKVKVVAVSKEAEANVRVEFTNGEVVYCHEAHEWTVFDRSTHNWRTQETREFLRINKFGRPKALWAGGRAAVQLPLTDAFENDDAVLPIDPYTLGAWLGDGSTTKACITHAPQETQVIAAVVAAGYPASAVCTHGTTGVKTTYFSPRYEQGRMLHTELKTTGVMGKKHIPTIYKTASLRQRLELLAGLIDTDGSVHPPDGRVQISSGDPLLAGDIAELIRTFGWHVCTSVYAPVTSSSGIVGKKDVHVISFTPDMDIPTKLPRKKMTHMQSRRRVGIKSVKLAPQGYVGRCIQVDSPDGLYVIGKTHIATHNSTLVSQFFPAWYLGRNPAKDVILCCYNAELAMRHAIRARQNVSEESYRRVFGDLSGLHSHIQLSKTEASARYWRLDSPHRGGLRAAGVGGGISGWGAKLLVIDDPLKGAKEADSEVIRNQHINWYHEDAYSRLSRGEDGEGAIIICQTRWHDQDLSGYLLKQQAEGGDLWYVLRLPAMAEDPLTIEEWAKANNVTPDRLLVADMMPRKGRAA